jgi:YesN/AraC family two-component response regulator
MSKIKVLLADDHAIMRDGLRALLSLQDDIEIVGEASEGNEAVVKTHLLVPDVVVMDIAMPRMDGLEADDLLHPVSFRTGQMSNDHGH